MGRDVILEGVSDWSLPGNAQGWFLDPYGLHEARYFSQGQPTKLVRDHDGESYDEPPSGTPPGPLFPAPPPSDPDHGLGHPLSTEGKNRYVFSGCWLLISAVIFIVIFVVLLIRPAGTPAIVIVLVPLTAVCAALAGTGILLTGRRRTHGKTLRSTKETVLSRRDSRQS
jgi:hypothetical protein